MYSLYAAISDLCADKKITGGKMCSDLGLSRGMMTDLKNGRKKTLSVDTLMKIADYFNVPLDLLLAQGPFAKWPLINQDRRGFILQSGVDPSILRVIFGVDPMNPDDASISIFSGFIGTAIESVEIDAAENWIITVKESFRGKAVGSTLKLRKENPKLPSNVFPVPKMRRVPILGSIRAGMPILAEENIEGYEYADVPADQGYFYLRVKGDSMVNARICDDDLVLIKQQPCADDGQIVACLVNGDEATLKRFYQQGDMVILKPENPAYNPIIVPCTDFDSGYAQILGVVTEVKFKL